MADHRHKRDTNARRLNPFRARAIVVAAPLSVMATAWAVTFGVITANPETQSQVTTSVSDATPTPADLGEQARENSAVSRSAPRNAPRIEREPTKVEKLMAGRAVAVAIKRADTEKWTTATLNLWSQPGEEAEKLGEIAEGKKVLLTGRSLYDRVEIVVDGESRWVTAGYLSAEKPFTLGGECTNGTTIDSGVSPSIVKIHEAVCAEFPEITTYGTLRGGGGDHSVGRAVDIMVSGERGWQVAEFVRKYYQELGVSYIIYSQQIWSVERGSEGWRGMEDRGSATANHYDHVHVSVF